MTAETQSSKRPWAIAGVAGVALLLVYGPYLAEFWSVWSNDDNYSHGFLIPVIAAYLAWTGMENIGEMPWRPTSLGFLPIALGAALYLAGEGMETVVAGTGGLFVKGVSLLLVLLGLVLLGPGIAYLKVLGLPILYLGFMVPLPGGVFKMVTLPMQDYATQVTTSVLQLWGVPTFREGNVIHLPSMTLGVVEACSGIRSLFTLLSLSAAIALTIVTRMHWAFRVGLVISAVPIAIITNAFRVTATGFLSHYWGPEMAQGFYHEFSGWIIFLVAFGILGAEVFLLSRVTGEMGDADPSEAASG